MLTIFLNLILYTLTCSFTHYFIRKLFNYNRDTSYFLIHFIFNMFMVYKTYERTFLCFTQPLKSMIGYHSIDPMIWLSSFHLSHIILDYKYLKIIDWIHHFFSVFIICLLNIYYFVGSLSDLAIFFGSGLPGGINYLCLYLVKIKIMSKETEKFINCYLNMLCRLPGLLYWMSLSWICWISNNIKISEESKKMSLYILLLQFIFVSGNGIFFASRVLLNYQKYLNKNNIKILKKKI